jgi:hypothetical protein
MSINGVDKSLVVGNRFGKLWDSCPLPVTTKIWESLDNGVLITL